MVGFRVFCDIGLVPRGPALPSSAIVTRNPEQDPPHVETDLRPHFDLDLPCPAEDALAVLAKNFETAPWEGDLRGNHVQVMVPAKERHLWSPWLTFEVQCSDEGCRLEGRFAPHPGAWTLYLAGYALFGFTAIGLAFFGLSQWIAEQPPTALWGIPACFVGMGLLYGLAFIGQGLTSKQMCAMRSFVKEAVKEAATGRASTPK